MAENQPPAEPPTPPTGLPALPAGAPLAQPPPGLDADEYRRFQEFQRFQDFQRFAQGQQGNQPVSTPEHHELATHLADMRQQLARIERVTNPPTWQKVLRNKWLHRLVWLVLLIVLATWGVPTLIHHYFGNSDSGNGPAALPLPLGQSGDFTTPYRTVRDLYIAVADNTPTDICRTFNVQARDQFAAVTGAPNCAAAIAKLHSQITDNDTYSHTNPAYLPSPQGGIMTVSSCSFPVTGGPRLGTLTLTQQQQGWEITGYAAGPTPCPASAPPTS